MELLIATLLFLCVFILGIVGNLLASETYSYVPQFSRWLINRAALRVARDQRERYREEWLAHNNELVGNLARLWSAVGILLAAHQLADKDTESRYGKWSKEIVRLARVAWNLKSVPARQSIIFVLLTFVIVPWSHLVDSTADLAYFVLVVLALYGTVLMVYFFTRPVMRSDMKYLPTKGLLALRRKL